jgi:medium-chain acyl-[acyl-carrier-protein] hydrolase
MMQAVHSNWFVRLRARPAPRMRLVCVPSAGAGASVFGRWPDLLPADVEPWAVQLPGRETRRREESLIDIHAIADECMALIDPLLDLPIAFFGHSMGALIAFELTRRLRDRGEEPAALFVSGRAAPHIVRGSPEIETMADDAFIDEMDRLYGGVPGLLRTDQEFRELYLPPLRADVTAVARYRPSDGAPLGLPVHVVGGTKDHSVPRESLDAWEPYASGDFDVHMFPGDHFHVYTAREAVIALVGGALARMSGRQTEGRVP